MAKQTQDLSPIVAVKESNNNEPMITPTPLLRLRCWGCTAVNDTAAAPPVRMAPYMRVEGTAPAPTITRISMRMLHAPVKSPAPIVRSISSSVQMRGETDVGGGAAAAAVEEVSQMVAGAVTAGLCIEVEAVVRLGAEEANGGGKIRTLVISAR